MADQLFFAQTVNFNMKILIIIFALFSNFKVFSQEIFIEGLEDIPIYSEMNYVEDSLILFDKINGRYVSTKTKGKYPQKEVQEFYKKILPNLGWKIKKKNLFERGNERLEIRFSKENDQTIAIFNIFPK
tara:strand:+ start:932 stop:1318 length:387 start_codon:yes stop_codon:yes gene_type:complete